MTTMIVDYGMGNLDSVARAIDECGGDAMIAGDPRALADASRIVLPGVGAFADGMAALRDRGWTAALHDEVLGAGTPVLGICLGMQLLATAGHEGSDAPCEGLGWIPGVVAAMRPSSAAERVPHVGWDEVYPTHAHSASALFDGVTAGEDFYFTHSYTFRPDDDRAAIATTPYAGTFVSAVARSNIYGVQFHPEKSQRAGFAVLRNFLDA